jgi:hypothetical protein
VKGREIVMIPSKVIDPLTKTIIVLEGLSGRPLSEICEEYKIHEEHYAVWRKHFPINAPKIFE